MVDGAAHLEFHARSVPPKFDEILDALDMTPGELCPGLVRADEETLAAKKEARAPLEEIVAIERALQFDAGYVYFRRFVGRPAMPVAYLYDWTERLGESEEYRSATKASLPQALSKDLVELHRRVWSACELPLVYVFLPTEVQVYHVLQGPEEDEHGVRSKPWKTIGLAGEVAEALNNLKALSARRLDDGALLEDSAARTLSLDGAAFMALSQQIGVCRATLHLDHGLDDALVKRLLILFVMIKYLEERKDRNNQGVFPIGTFEQFGGAVGFVDLLRRGSGAVVTFLDQLAQKDRFNGEVFKLSSRDREMVHGTDLNPFADLLDGRMEGAQRTFWRRYSFNDLPVELISHLYEQFLPRKPGVVYTPPFLVNFILDEALPLSQSTPEGFRLIDPACGSGVFLVGAFKRLVHRWQRDNGFRKPDVEPLKRLLRDHVFGMDTEGDAVRLTLFSLSVALCDSLDPRLVWPELHFDDCMTTTNLLRGDFFARAREGCWDATFDLVIGNPPFGAKLTSAAKHELAAIKQEDKEFQLPDKQTALLFLKTATRIAKAGGRIALIQPSGPFLYGEGSIRFRKPFLKQFHVPLIVDFTHMSRVLFRRPWALDVASNGGGTKKRKRGGSKNPGDVAVAVVFAEMRAPLETPLLHITVRRAVQAEQKLMFEIDHYDLHFVSRRDACEVPGIWKENFIGGGRISHLLRRLQGVDSLGDFLEGRAQDGWYYGEGYIGGSKEKIGRVASLDAKPQETLSTTEIDELRKLKKRYKRAPWLTGRNMLPTSAFRANRVAWDKMKKIEQEWFAEPRRKSLFHGPLLLIKELVEVENGRVPVVLVPEGVRFLDRILGIHAPKSDLEHLERIQASIKGDPKFVHFFVAATSAEYLVNKSSAFRAADLLRLPFPESTDEVKLTPVEEMLVADVHEHVADFKRNGERAAVQQRPDDKQLKQFGDAFCRVLGSVYRGLHRAEPVTWPGAICYPFYFGDAPSHHFEPGTMDAARVEALLVAKVGTTMRCQRIVRLFAGNMLLLVKPPQLRYWLRSIAVRDADEVFAELQGQGY